MAWTMPRLVLVIATASPLAIGAHLLRHPNQDGQVQPLQLQEVPLALNATTNHSSGWEDPDNSWIFGYHEERGRPVNDAKQKPIRSLSPLQVASLLGVVVLLLVALSPVLYKEGPKPFAAVVLYIASLSFVKVSSKHAFNEGFSYPYALTTFHMLVSAIVSCILDRPLLAEATSTFRISAVKAVSLGLSNTALVFGSAAFVSILGALTPCTTYVVDAVRTRQVSAYRSAVILFICAGGAVSVTGELKFSVIAFILTIGACLSRSLRIIWSHDLLEANVGVYRLVAWSSIWSFFIMLIPTFVFEGRRPFNAVGTLSSSGLRGLLVSAVAAVALNILQCFCLKFLGPVLQTLFGSLELVAVVMLAVVLLREQVSRVEWIGLLLVCCGCAAIKCEDGARRAFKCLGGTGTEGDLKQKLQH